MSKTVDPEPTRVANWKANIVNGVDEYNRRVVIETETDDFVSGKFTEIDEYTYKHDKVISVKRIPTTMHFHYRKKSLA
jgi:hypothetical protein